MSDPLVLPPPAYAECVRCSSVFPAGIAFCPLCEPEGSVPTVVKSTLLTLVPKGPFYAERSEKDVP